MPNPPPKKGPWAQRTNPDSPEPVRLAAVSHDYQHAQDYQADLAAAHANMVYICRVKKNELPELPLNSFQNVSCRDYHVWTAASSTANASDTLTHLITQQFNSWTKY